MFDEDDTLNGTDKIVVDDDDEDDESIKKTIDEFGAESHPDADSANNDDAEFEEEVHELDNKLSINTGTVNVVDATNDTECVVS